MNGIILMLTDQWLQDKGKWYLLYSNGIMAHDTTMYGYIFASDGTATKI